MSQGAPSRISARVAIAFATLAVVLEVSSLVFYSAAAGFSPHLSVAPIVLLQSGAGGAAALIRWGSLIDMFGYLCLAPVVLYLWDRHEGAAFIDLYALAGLALIVIGSAGAVVMSTSASPLIAGYSAASPTARPNVEVVFGAVYRAVVVGMWQTLETIPAAVWLLGTANAARGRSPRIVVSILAVIGLANAGLAVFRLSGL
jgi:hypothetical protein